MDMFINKTLIETIIHDKALLDNAYKRIIYILRQKDKQMHCLII